MKAKFLALLLVAVTILTLFAGCAKDTPDPGTTDNNSDPSKNSITIGVSFATMQEEKWERCAENMQKKADELGAKLVIQSANGDEELQYSQCENLITQGVDALIVIAQDGDAASAIVEAAHEAKIPVVANDRMINNCELDFYVSFDCYTVGVLQAQFAVEHAPTGNYFLISGSPKDNNALLMRNGQMSVLQPYIDKGDIKIVVDQWCDGWSAEDALQYTGHAVGGVCPFAVPDSVPVYLDVSLKRFDTVFPAAGSAASAVRLTCDELERASRSRGWIDVCKGWEEDQ